MQRRKLWPARSLRDPHPHYRMRIVSPLILDAVCDCPECEEDARLTAMAESCVLLCEDCRLSPTGVQYPCSIPEEVREEIRAELRGYE